MSGLEKDTDLVGSQLLFQGLESTRSMGIERVAIGGKAVTHRFTNFFVGIGRTADVGPDVFPTVMIQVKNAHEVFEQCKDIEEVKYWGFKNVGLPKDEMKALTAAMKAAGKTTFLEVVTYDEASCLDGAQTAIDCGFDYLMGTIYYDSVAKLLRDNGMDYLPFVGKVSGSPSILEGTNEEIIQNAKDLMAKGIKGFDILAYRHVVDGEKLAYDFCKAVDAKICIAGSINSFARIDTMFDIGPWTFTMGSALFEKKFVADGSFRENLQAVADYMAKK